MPIWLVSVISASPFAVYTLWLPHASYTYFTTVLPFLSSIAITSPCKNKECNFPTTIVTLLQSCINNTLF